ncbi:hypothetical protein [Sinorhizobium fredii]|uniref:hypothetical protein n=1 Tax=Rhizobium fredii TaxID=380 RepID=UPI0005B49DE3|nr:hypothetical protein [Sinorhizobium fredii]
MTSDVEIPYLVLRPGQRGPEPCLAHLPDFTSPRFYNQLRAVVEAVTGIPMEHVNVFWRYSTGERAHYMDMFVNEQGMLNRLPRNELATRIYRNNVLTHDPFRFPTPEALPWIAGPAVLFKERVWR